MGTSTIQKHIQNKTPVLVFLTNGVKLRGIITNIESDPVLSYVLFSPSNGLSQLVHVHAASTVMPDSNP